MRWGELLPLAKDRNGSMVALYCTIDEFDFNIALWRVLVRLDPPISMPEAT